MKIKNLDKLYKDDPKKLHSLLVEDFEESDADIYDLPKAEGTCPHCDGPLQFVGYQGNLEEFKCPECDEYYYFDENGNEVTESLNEAANDYPTDTNKLKARLREINKAIENGEDPEYFAYEKKKIFDQLDSLGSNYYDESLDEAKNDTLNPAIWDENNELKPEVRETLQKVADTFIHKLEEDDIPLDVKDLIIVGSNANYNYGPQSDIDLHIVADFSQFKGREKELAEKIYNAKKSIFNDKYDPVIRGFDVEIYVEPAEDKDMNNIPDEIEGPEMEEALTEAVDFNTIFNSSGFEQNVINKMSFLSNKIDGKVRRFIYEYIENKFDDLVFEIKDLETDGFTKKEIISVLADDVYEENPKLKYYVNDLAEFIYRTVKYIISNRQISSRQDESLTEGRADPAMVAARKNRIASDKFDKMLHDMDSGEKLASKLTSLNALISKLRRWERRKDSSEELGPDYIELSYSLPFQKFNAAERFLSKAFGDYELGTFIEPKNDGDVYWREYSNWGNTGLVIYIKKGALNKYLGGEEGTVRTESLTEAKNETLNPAIWDENNELKPEVKKKLIYIADVFIDKLLKDDVPLDVEDVIIVGSNANYNYTPYSDIDLHIVADTSDFKGREKELVEKIYQCKKAMFNDRYDPVINGFNVELYIEPADDRNNNEIPDEIEEPVEEPNGEEEVFEV